MDIQHNTSFKSILEDDSIPSTSKAHIHSCSSKGARLWLVVRPSIHSFHITHFTFTSALSFCLDLIQHLTFNLFTCECGHELDAFGTHLTHCAFGGQRITTHDAIWNFMYVFAWESGHSIWKERWYAFTSKVSLWTNIYMTQKDQVFVVDVVIINPMWETVVSSAWHTWVWYWPFHQGVCPSFPQQIIGRSFILIFLHSIF
jgi:hypothetical protein